MRAAAVRYGPVVALTLLGAMLRFPTLDRQSFWLDELVTASLLDRSLGDVLGEIPRTEATPYLYYVVAWLWSSVFGLGEVGLRSLSALAGTATIPVAYLAGAVLVSRRAGIVAAALVATSPFLVWYSQEARSYALFALLGATSVLAFGLALRGDRRWLAGWAVVCALTLATHYFGVFLVGAEAVWLLVRLRPRLPVVLASLVPVATLLAHLPVLLDQRGNGEAVAGSSLAVEDRGHPEEPRRRLQLSARGRGKRRCCGARPRRSRARRAARSGRAPRRARRRLARGRRDPDARSSSRSRAPTTSSPGTRSSRLSPRRCASAPALPPGGSGSRRRASSASLSAGIALAPALDTSYGRTDWRGAGKALSTTQGTRAIVVTPYMSRTLWRPYLPDLREPGPDGATVREIAAIGLATEGGYSAGHVEPPDVERSSTGEGLPGCRDRAEADLHPGPLPRRPADVRPDVDARRARAHGRAARGAAAGLLSAARVDGSGRRRR